MTTALAILLRHPHFPHRVACTRHTEVRRNIAARRPAGGDRLA